MDSYLEHPLLRPETVEKRLFQLDLASSALKSSTLIVVPTGLGKTVIALMVLLARMDRGKILFLAPTKPLVEQHASFLKRVLLDGSTVAFMTGEVQPEKRREVWEESRIVVSTPQVIENDLLSRRISLKEVSCIIFDEAHRATGDYAYVYIASRYQKEAEDPLVLGITASPGSQSERIEEICSNLGISSIQTRTEDDPDVEPFVHHREIEWIKVKVPDELLSLKSSIEDILTDRINTLNSLGITEQVPGLLGAKIDPRASKRELLELQERLRANAVRSPNPALFKGVSVMAEVLKIYHAVELAETQGVDALARYFERLESEATSRGGSKASRRLMEDPRIQAARSALASLNVEHPKLAAAKDVLDQQLGEKPGSRIMVFTNYRDTASALLKFLKDDPAIRAVRFVGQASRQNDEGLSQKKQAEMLSRFRSGEFNVLIATSVGEEGIDIPSTDMVLFYEPVPSEIRSIQRKGRTGRARAGKVVVLMAKGTRDEAYYWISERKEKNMQKQIRGLSTPSRFGAASSIGAVSGSGTASSGQLDLSSAARAVARAAAKQARITDAADGIEAEETEKDADRPEIMVYVDPREKEMGKRLEAQGLSIALKNLEVGDYIVSDRVAIERKTAEDFVSSIIDPSRNLFRQVEDLARSFQKPLLILEGRNLYSRQMSPNSIRGAMAAIAIDYGVPILPTENSDETAAVIALLARREKAEGREPKVHGRKTARTLKEQQEYMVSALPSVGPAVARNLLKHFGSVQAVVNASEEELQKVELVGPKIAERIRELMGSEYKG
jgi:Fanconi anemia group M protein